jgi:hypothetical protein
MPLGRPETMATLDPDPFAGNVKEPVAVAVTVTVAVPIDAIDRLAVLRLRAMPGPCNTFTVYVLVTVSPSPVAVTLNENEPTGAAVVAARVSVDDPVLDDRLTVPMLHEAETPVGRPETESVTGP